MTTITHDAALLAPPAKTLDPVAVAAKLVTDHGGAKKPDLSAIKRELDAIRLQDAPLGVQVRAEVERLLSPVQRGELARATYAVGGVTGGVTIDPNARSIADQFRAPHGSSDHKSYAALDKMFGDGNWRTDDSARITGAINDLTTSGLSLEQLAAKHKASDAGWTATAGDLIASVSLGGHLTEAARPAVASLARDAGLGQTEWGASLQRVLDKPGAIMAFHAGAAQGFVEGAKDFVVTIASLVGRAVQHGADTGVMGIVGDAARGVVPDGVKGWLRDRGAADGLNAALPSYRRGEAANAAVLETGRNIAQYFAKHTPAQVAADVKVKIGAMWDGIKADHAAAVAKGPEAEARWWGRIAGRATFEVASTFVPVAGVAGKIGKGAKAADVVVDALNVVDKAADAIRIADKTADAVTAVDKVGDAAKVVEATADGSKAAGTVDKVADAATVGRAVLTLEEIATKLRDSVATELEALRAAGMSTGKLKPAVAIVMDRTTGATSRVYLNNAAGDLPAALNAAIADRMAGAYAIDYIKTAGAGSHCEIYAANELLNRGSKLENLVVYTEQVGGTLSGTVKPPCPHCAHLLEGVTYVR